MKTYLTLRTALTCLTVCTAAAWPAGLLPVEPIQENLNVLGDQIGEALHLEFWQRMAGIPDLSLHTRP